MTQAEKNLSRVQTFAFVVAVLICVALSGGFVISGYSKTSQHALAELDSRINPNVASAVSMARLPGVGVVRASAIVAYRQDYQGDASAFESTDDLQKVKGIGPKTAEKISKWLKF